MKLLASIIGFPSFIGVYEVTLHFQTFSNVLPIHFFGEFISFNLLIQGLNHLKKYIIIIIVFTQNYNLIPFSET